MLLTVARPLGGQGDQSTTSDSEKFAENRGKEEKIMKNQEKNRKNWEEKANLGKVLSLCPSWQTGLATLQVTKQWLSNLLLICKL